MWKGEVTKLMQISGFSSIFCPLDYHLNNLYKEVLNNEFYYEIITKRKRERASTSKLVYILGR
jgi:hypothetical protein